MTFNLLCRYIIYSRGRRRAIVYLWNYSICIIGAVPIAGVNIVNSGQNKCPFDLLKATVALGIIRNMGAKKTNMFEFNNFR